MINAEQYRGYWILVEPLGSGYIVLIRKVGAPDLVEIPDEFRTQIEAVNAAQTEINRLVRAA